MSQRLGFLGGDVHNKITAECHVQNLLPATDRQQRFLLPENFLDQSQLGEIPRRIGLHYCFLQFLRHLRRVQLCLHVIASRQQHTVGSLHALGDDLSCRSAG